MFLLVKHIPYKSITFHLSVQYSELNVVHLQHVDLASFKLRLRLSSFQNKYLCLPNIPDFGVNPRTLNHDHSTFPEINSQMLVFAEYQRSFNSY